MADVYDKVMELAKRRGFVWPSSEIYGSVAGLIDYGPLGAMMKRKIENLWRDYYVAREGYFEIECPTVGEEAIYIASGHVKGFADKMVQCPHCKEYHRADHVCEAHNIEHAETKTLGELTEILRNLPCPACGKTFDGINNLKPFEDVRVVAVADPIGRYQDDFFYKRPVGREVAAEEYTKRIAAAYRLHTGLDPQTLILHPGAGASVWAL